MQHNFANCPPLDITLMGAHVTKHELTEGEKKFIQKCNEEAAALLFICGGFQPALDAGILAGKTVTAPRPMVPMLKAKHPECNWVTKRWANDGKQLVRFIMRWKLLTPRLQGRSGPPVSSILRA